MGFAALVAVFLSSISFGVQARPTPADGTVGIIWTFPNGTWIENLAVRANGEILATSLSKAAIYLLNPFQHTAEVAHQFESTDGVLGIAEIEPDVFAVATAEVNLKTSAAVNGTAKLWKLDMWAWTSEPDIAVSLIANLSDALLPDGVVALPEAGLVLIADATAGVVWRVNTVDGKYEVAIDDPSFKASNPVLPLGVDGLRTAGDQLYFTNPGSNLLGRVTIDAQGNAIGPVQNVTNDLIFPDDFALREDGTAWVAGGNTIWKVDPQGDTTLVAGGVDDPVLVGATSAQLGRTSIDQDVLYIGTNGGQLAPVGIVHGGQIAAVNINAAQV